LSPSSLLSSPRSCHCVHSLLRLLLLLLPQLQLLLP
jgi:hypothetical protein